jgi:hypothetical protein
MNLFTAGLGEPMTSDVEMQRPIDLQAAMSLERAFEHRASVAPSAPTIRYPPRSRQTPTGAPARHHQGQTPPQRHQQPVPRVITSYHNTLPFPPIIARRDDQKEEERRTLFSSKEVLP